MQTHASTSPDKPSGNARHQLLFARAIGDNRWRSIEEVEGGAACRCRCAVCGNALVARQGSKRRWHFAHRAGESCLMPGEDSAFESLRRLVQQRIAEGASLVLPQEITTLQATVAGQPVEVPCYIAPRTRLRPSDVSCDREHDGQRFDLLMRVRGYALGILMRDRCAATLPELALADPRLGVLELDLRSVGEVVRDSDDLKVAIEQWLLLEGGRRWMMHPRELRAHAIASRRLAAEVEYRRSLCRQVAPINSLSDASG